MSKPKILVVGCGAVGLTQGYFLSSSAEITYLVRPGRTSAFQGPKKLYDYKENVLRTFDGYRVIESPSEVEKEEFFCLFDTLDGHTARSEGGQATLRAVGDLIRDHTDTFVVYEAVGLDMAHFYARTMGISTDRLVFSASIIAHQPTAAISIPASCSSDLIAQADMLYSYSTGAIGLIMMNTQPKLVKAFSSVYNQHPKLRVMVMPGFIESSGFMMVMMLQFMAWNIDGWHTIPELYANQEVWNLMLRAQAEILRLPRHGWTGRLMAMVFGSWVTMKMLSSMLSVPLPLQVHEFNAFHHGDKVVRQDLLVLEDLIADGEKAKQKMVALREVVRRATEKMEAGKSAT